MALDRTNSVMVRAASTAVATWHLQSGTRLQAGKWDADTTNASFVAVSNVHACRVHAAGNQLVVTLMRMGCASSQHRVAPGIGKLEVQDITHQCGPLRIRFPSLCPLNVLFVCFSSVAYPATSAASPAISLALVSSATLLILVIRSCLASRWRRLGTCSVLVRKKAA